MGEVKYGAGSLLFGLWAEDMHLRMDGFFGCRDEERWGGVPCRQGVFYKVGRLNRRNGGEKKKCFLLIAFCAREELWGFLQTSG